MRNALDSFIGTDNKRVNTFILPKQILLFSVIVVMLFSGFVSAEDWAVDLSGVQGEEGWSVDIPIPTLTSPTNYSFVYVNSSNFWDNLDTPSDIVQSIYWYNHTTIVYNTWNALWISTFNSTYDLYSYNHTQAVFDLWNATWSVDHDKKGDGSYLYNDSETMYFNESLMNLTVRNLAEVNEYEEVLTCTAISGDCSNTSSVSIDFLITQLTVTPTTNTTKYNFESTRDDGDIIDKDRVRHTGIWDIYKNYALFNDTVNMNITNSDTDEQFTMRIKYIDNFRP